MKRFISYFVVFIIGFLVCVWAIYYMYGSPKDFAGVQSVDRPRGGVTLTERGINKVRDAADIVGEYVVNIDTESRPVRTPFFFGSPFGGREPTAHQASGVVFSDDGYILTNNHVLRGAEKLYVTLQDDPENRFTAKVVGRDSKTDLAVIT